LAAPFANGEQCPDAQLRPVGQSASCVHTPESIFDDFLMRDSEWRAGNIQPVNWVKKIRSITFKYFTPEDSTQTGGSVN
jgi:hypothetical protein